jgi:hypothetical protein
MQNDKKLSENKDVCISVLDKVGKPEHYLMCKAMNVYDDKYRVNIYSKRWVDGIEGKSISKSYFVRYGADGLHILS